MTKNLRLQNDKIPVVTHTKYDGCLAINGNRPLAVMKVYEVVIWFVYFLPFYSCETKANKTFHTIIIIEFVFNVPHSV